MACLGVRFGGNGVLADRRVVNFRCRFNRSSRLAIPGRDGRGGGRGRISMAMADLERIGGRSNTAVARDVLDQWVKGSVVQIVENLEEAPLFVRIHASERGEAARLETDKAVGEEDWPVLKRKWEREESPTPDGVIFVESLDRGESEDDGNDSESSNEWGIVVQGRGPECGSTACYLLKTSKVGLESGLGLLCTHFCLMKVKNFRETAKSQLKNCWLLQSQ